MVEIDAAMGTPTGKSVACPGPRGLAFDAAGGLWVASFPPEGPGALLRLAPGGDRFEPRVTAGLAAPFGLALDDAAGQVYASDLGDAQ